MTEFSKDFVSSIDGTSLEISTKELSGGARIYYIFNDVFGQALVSIDPSQNLSLSDIRTAIRNSTGPRPSLFVPEVAFDLLVKPQIKLLEAPSLRCVELVYEELMKICHNCTSPVSTTLSSLILGITTFPSTFDATRRSGLGVAPRETRPYVRIRLEPYRYTSGVYKYQPPRLPSGFSGDSSGGSTAVAKTTFASVLRG